MVWTVRVTFELILSCSIEDFLKLNSLEKPRKELIPVQSAVIDETMIIASLQAQIQTDLVGLNFDI